MFRVTSGYSIDVLIVAVVFNMLMIFYAFFTDAFNLFNEDLVSSLNEIEVIDLDEIRQNNEIVN